MKVDDDMWVNLEVLQEMVILLLGLLINKLFGSCFMNVCFFRDLIYKYYVLFLMFNEFIYLLYCLGIGYLINMVFIKEVVNFLFNILFFLLEDIYFVLCLQYFGYKIYNIGEFYVYKVYFYFCLYCFYIVIISYGVMVNELKMIWKVNCKVQIRVWMGNGVRSEGFVLMNSYYDKVEVI